MGTPEPNVTRRYVIDPNSETWKAVQQHIDERLQVRWRNLGQPSVPMDETENCRGAIEELTHLEQLGQQDETSGFNDDERDTIAAAARHVSERGGSY